MHHNMTIARANGTQACAACKYQRRKCAPDCILAPYFPHDRQRQFLNAHKLFGVSNIVKIIRHLDQRAKDDAMRTIIFQSDVRAHDPVGGCLRIICDLEHQIYCAKAELKIVLHHLAICRAQAQAQAQSPSQVHVQQQQQQQMLSGIIMHDDAITDSSKMNGSNHVASYETVNYEHFRDPGEEFVWKSDEDQVALQDTFDAWGLQDDSTTSSSFNGVNNQGQGAQVCFDECDEIKPILEIPDERHELKFDLEDTIEASDEVIFKEEKALFKEDEECFPYAQDHDLKGAGIFAIRFCKRRWRNWKREEL